MSAAIAIFVKTPGLSPLKTRLCASLKHQRPNAEAWVKDFYLQAAQSVAEAALQTGAPVYWALAEVKGSGFHAWQSLPQVLQIEKSEASTAIGLAQRMHHVMAQLIARHGAGVLLGADTPQVDGRELQAMARYLSATEPRQLLGPATDGGFWTYGSNRVAPLSWWQAVRYSTATTGAEFCTQFEALCPLHTQSSQTDVDHAQDLTACLAALQALSSPSKAQQKLTEQLVADLTTFG
jgi:uncharacterized protein